MYSRGEENLEKNRKDRKETDFVKNEDPFVSHRLSLAMAGKFAAAHLPVSHAERYLAFLLNASNYHNKQTR
jgi:hypothetical protein